MIDTTQLSALVSAFRVETEKESISPEQKNASAAAGSRASITLRQCESKSSMRTT